MGGFPSGDQVQGTPNPGGLQENAGTLPDGVSEAGAGLPYRPCTSLSPGTHPTPTPTALGVPLHCRNSRNRDVAVLD